MFDEIDFTKLKYVLYARKSTEEEARQIRSIDDQIKECKKYAEHIGLKIVDVLTESKSAKKPRQRPIFTSVIKNINLGIYDGIIAWNPDRLARNMLEGGEIIDLLDQGVIKDLKFVTHSYTHDANGKMLLGMAFVLSKQYSDKLSQDVKRGVQNALFEGRIFAHKHGYIRDEDGLQRPDKKNFPLIKNAWIMRSEGESLENIAKYLDENGFYRKVISTGELQQMTKQKLSNMFIDPFYYGLLIQTNQKVDLTNIYDFEPVTSYEIYQKVQMLSRATTTMLNRPQRAFYPLKQMIKCSYCGENMIVAPSRSSTKNKRYLYFRCDTKFCNRPKKSIRSKIVFDYIYEFLEEGIGFTEKEFIKYKESLSKVNSSERADTKVKIHSKEASLKYIDGEIKRISLGLINLQKANTTAYQINLEQLNKYEEERNTIKTSIERLKQSIGSEEEDEITLEQFLNLSKNAGKSVKYGDAILKDAIIRLIFLNLSVDESKVADFVLNEPFNSLLKNKNVLQCRGGETRTHDPCVPNAVL